MRRTQLYLDEDLWNVLHARARKENTSISDLVRQAVRERYLGDRDERIKAMREFVGIRRHQSRGADAVKYVQQLRRGNRLERLYEK